jgi:hypothetical protein
MIMFCSHSCNLIKQHPDTWYNDTLYWVLLLPSVTNKPIELSFCSFCRNLKNVATTLSIKTLCIMTLDAECCLCWVSQICPLYWLWSNCWNWIKLNHDTWYNDTWLWVLLMLSVTNKPIMLSFCSLRSNSKKSTMAISISILS